MVKIPANFFRAEINWAFDDLATYARIMEDQIEGLVKDVRFRLEWTSFGDEAEEQLEWDEYRRTFKTVLPRTLRYSCVVSLLGVIEASLRNICEKLYEKNKLSIKPRKYKEKEREIGKGRSLLDIRLSYIQDEAKVRVPAHSFTASLYNLKKVRNRIVHAEGRAEGRKDLDKLTRDIGELKGFTVMGEYIEIKKGACESLTRQAGDWMNHIMDACGSPYRKS
jgi:hypothetical protein